MKNIINVVLFLTVGLLFSSVSFAQSGFEREVGEIQIIDGVVRLWVGTTYGTCGSIEGWWGWSISNPNHQAWLSLVLFAVAQGLPVELYDAQSSCAGPGGIAIGLEGIYLNLD